MKKLLLTFALLLATIQVASAVTFDTVWVNYSFPGFCQYVCFSSDTNKIYAAIDSTIYILDLHNGNIIDSMEKAPDAVSIYTTMSFIGNRIVSLLNNDQIAVWDNSTKKIIKIFQKDTINNIDHYNISALSADGRYLIGDASSTFLDYYHLKSYQTRLFVYDLNADTLVKWLDSLWNPTKRLQYITFSPDGNYFVIAAAFVSNNGTLNNGLLTKYTVNGWQQQKVLESYSDNYYEYLSYSSDGKYLAGSKPEGYGSCYVWDMEADTLFRKYTFSKLGQSYKIINFSPDNQYLLFGGGGFLGPDTLFTQIWDFVNDTSLYNTSSYSTSGIYMLNERYLLLATDLQIYLLTTNWNKTSVKETNANNENALQILPNPASEAITITYIITHAGNAKLSLFNQLGQEIAMLKNEWEEAGKHDIRFTVSDFRLNAGVYFVRLVAGSEVGIGKVLVY